jgi:aspartate/methionine/tyrosine aminotransferase
MSPRQSERVGTLRRTMIREIFESAPKDALNLGLGQPDLDPPAVLREALARAAAEGPSGYGPTAGDRALRDAIGARYAGFARGGDDVMVTLGCQQATFAVLGCLLDPGDEVLIPDPGFPGSVSAAQVLGALPKRYPLRAGNGFHIDPADVIAALGPRTRAVVVITPSNPTGTVEPRTTLDALVAATAERGIALLVDDTYTALNWTADTPAPGAPAGPLPHVVVCGGLSKSVALTGWRVGWAVCPDAAFMAKAIAFQQTLLTCPATPIQAAARAAFTPQGEAGARAIKARFRARRDLVERVLGGAGVRLAPLEGAFYAWADASRAGGGIEFARRLLEDEKIVVIPGAAFGSEGDGWIRISYAQDDALLERALTVIAARLTR